MSEAEVKNGVAQEAPKAEDLKAKKRSAEDDDVDVKKQKKENGHDAENGEDDEEAEEEEDLGDEEEDLDGEGEDELDEEDGGEGEKHFFLIILGFGKNYYECESIYFIVQYLHPFAAFLYQLLLN